MVRVKTSAIISDTKTHATRVRTEFNVRAFRLTMFNDVAKRFLGDTK